MKGVKHRIVKTLAQADAIVDDVLYRPAIVKAFLWLPRWWNCDLAKFSIRLDDRWQTRYWIDDAFGVPGEPCDACGRRASWLVSGGPDDEFDDDETYDDGPPSFLQTHEIATCGWCQLRIRIMDEDDLGRALRDARQDSVAWRWRWRVRGWPSAGE